MKNLATRFIVSVCITLKTFMKEPQNLKTTNFSSKTCVSVERLETTLNNKSKRPQSEEKLFLRKQQVYIRKLFLPKFARYHDINQIKEQAFQVKISGESIRHSNNLEQSNNSEKKQESHEVSEKRRKTQKITSVVLNDVLRGSINKWLDQRKLLLFSALIKLTERIFW